MDSLFAGGYRSAFKGRGMEFEEVRPYVPGDDVRHIDWNVTARAQEPYIKEFREERELTLVLALDLSGSMSFGSGGRDGLTDKRLQMARVAGALAYAAVRNGDRVGLLVFTDQVELFVPPRKSRGHAWRVIRECFEHRPVRFGTDIGLAAEHLGKVLKRRAVVCFVSDFLVEDAQHTQAMAILGQRHRTHAFVVHDPLESSSPVSGLIEVLDAETGRPTLIDLAALRQRLPVARRQEMLRRTGAYTSLVSTQDDPFRVLLRHFAQVR